MQQTKTNFLLRNLLRGFIWFCVIIAAYVLAEDYIQSHFIKDIEAASRNPLLLFGIFLGSEIFFGMIPPELFMLIWIIERTSLHQYVVNLSILTALSYSAGVVGYYIGRNLSRFDFVKKYYDRYVAVYSGHLNLYGGFLVFVGAVTPVPFSATCMLAGSINYPYRRFLTITIFRVLRFALYGWMVWSFPNLFSIR